MSENIGLPFGNIIAGESTSLGNSATKKRFTSYDRSDSTTLDYAVNRQYSAAQGRFTQVDPIGMEAVSLTNPQSLNLYSYCFNDPINHTDPEGLDGGASLVIAIVIAVLGALRTIFGGGGRVAAKMGTRIERRLPPNETGSRGRQANPTVRSGSGAVEDFIFRQTQDVNAPEIADMSDVILLTIETWELGPWYGSYVNWASGIVNAAIADAKKVKPSKFLPCLGDAGIRAYINTIPHPAVSVPNGIIGALGGEINPIQAALGQDFFLGQSYLDMFAQHSAIVRDGFNSFYNLVGGDPAKGKAEKLAARPNASANFKAKQLLKFDRLSALKTLGRRSAYVAAFSAAQRGTGPS